MHQPSICEHSELACPHLSSIFCLAPNIRLRIYLFAGLVNHDDIDMNRWRKVLYGPCINDLTFTCSLLLTCRTIYHEASSILYSTNRFFVRHRKFGDLRLLQNLDKGALSSLTHLTVHLNVFSCERGEPCYNAFLGNRHAESALGSLSETEKAVISEWQSAASQVMAGMRPSTLQFNLVCDVGDFDTATQIVEPLLGVCTLASCAIRLGWQPDSLLQDLAMRTATRATGLPPYRTESPFRFLDLPQELRRQILEYTDLVTPLCEVEWSPVAGYFLRYSTWICQNHERLPISSFPSAPSSPTTSIGSTRSGKCPPDLHYACQFRNCWQYSNSGCFCRRHHAAFSPQCHCWSPPTPLFLVCRALREEAQAVFFMRNRFVVTPLTGCSVVESTPSRLEISTFLTDVVPCSALQWLRFLEVVFPPFDGDYLRPNEPAYREWSRIVTYLREKLCLSMLTMRVYFGYGEIPRSADNISERAKVFQTYGRTLRQFSQFSGLKRYFVHVAWPFAPVSRALPTYQPETVKREIRGWERRFEQLVMGSEYDSRSLPDGKPHISQWLVAFLMPSEQILWK